MAWTLADIRAKVRTLASRPSTNQISNDSIDSYINDFYRFDFCELVGLESFKSDWTQEATATDSGEYTISEDVVNLEEPVFANDEKITVYYDKDWFFTDYPDEEDYITSPTLAIGSSDTTAVANSAFKYEIGGWVYAKAAAETTFPSGLNAVPQNKYGAWLLEIDANGNVIISEASANATGYLTAALAVHGLPRTGTGTRSLPFTSGSTEISVSDTITGATSGATATVTAVILSSGTWGGGDAAGTIYLKDQSGNFQAENLDVGATSNVATISGDSSAGSANTAVMGYVTAINTSGAFTPGTTALDASGVTDTYTNGSPERRGAPSAILLDMSAEKAYLRPKVDDTYLVKSKLTLQRPSTLTSSDEPLNTKWGLALALGAAIKIIAANENDTTKILKLKTGHEKPTDARILEALPGSLDYEISNIRLKTLRQMKNRRVERTF